MRLEKPLERWAPSIYRTQPPSSRGEKASSVSELGYCPPPCVALVSQPAHCGVAEAFGHGSLPAHGGAFHHLAPTRARQMPAARTDHARWAYGLRTESLGPPLAIYATISANLGFLDLKQDGLVRGGGCMLCDPGGMQSMIDRTQPVSENQVMGRYLCSSRKDGQGVGYRWLGRVGKWLFS